MDDSSDMIKYLENSFDIFTISVFIMMLKEVFVCISVVRMQYSVCHMHIICTKFFSVVWYFKFPLFY